MTLVGLLIAGWPALLRPESLFDSPPTVTVWGQFVRVLGPGSESGLQGGGLRAQALWPIKDAWSVGLDYGQAGLAGAGAQVGFGSLGLVARYSAPPLGGLNPYIQSSLGYDLFHDSFSQPLGGFFHGQVIVGDVYVLSSAWAVDAGLGLDILDGPPSPIQALSPRLGLNYNFGGQPARNLYHPPAPPVTLGAQPEALALAAPLGQLLGFKWVPVRRGDNLWRLAHRRSVLGNGFLWPLIYLSNRDQIRDPARIQPGMKLKVYHHYDDTETQAALAAARDRRQLTVFLASGALADH